MKSPPTKVKIDLSVSCMHGGVFARILLDTQTDNRTSCMLTEKLRHFVSVSSSFATTILMLQFLCEWVIWCIGIVANGNRNGFQPDSVRLRIKHYAFELPPPLLPPPAP